MEKHEVSVGGGAPLGVASFLPSVEFLHPETLDLLVSIKKGVRIPDQEIRELEKQGYLTQISQYDYSGSVRAKQRIPEITKQLRIEKEELENAQRLLDEDKNKTYFLGNFGKVVSELLTSGEKKLQHKQSIDEATYAVSQKTSSIETLTGDLKKCSLAPDYTDAVSISGGYLVFTESAKEIIKTKEDSDAFVEASCRYQEHIDAGSYEELLELFDNEQKEELAIAVIKAVGERNTQEATDALVEMFCKSRNDDEKLIIIQSIGQDARIGGTDALIQCYDDASTWEDLPRTLYSILTSRLSEGERVQTELKQAFLDMADESNDSLTEARRTIAEGFSALKTQEALDTLVEFFNAESDDNISEVIIREIMTFDEPEASSALNSAFDYYSEYDDVPLYLWEALISRLDDETSRQNVIDGYENVSDDETKTKIIESVQSSMSSSATDVLCAFLDSDVEYGNDTSYELLKALFMRRGEDAVNQKLIGQFSSLSTDEMINFSRLCIDQDTEESRELLVNCILSLESDEDDLYDALCAENNHAETRALVAIASESFEADAVPSILKVELAARLDFEGVQDCLFGIYSKLTGEDDRTYIIDDVESSDSNNKIPLLKRFLEVEQSQDLIIRLGELVS